MHELPKELAESLRSWRGSVHGNRNSAMPELGDLEKGPEPLVEGNLGQQSWHEGPSILHSTKSTQDLHQAFQQQKSQIDQPLLPGSTAVDPHVASGVAQSQPTNPPQALTTSSPQIASTVDAKLFANAPNIKESNPPADHLHEDTNPLAAADFYVLMGMRVPMSRTQNPRELRIPHGLYYRIDYDLRYVQTKYRIFDVLAYVLLILQLLLSALFIILGSLTSVDTHITIAVLGAVSTVIAGALALMKGQGLPNRLREARDSLRKVQLSADELYWNVMANRAVYFADVKRIRDSYARVTESYRQSHRDVWATAGDSVAGVPSSVKQPATAAVSQPAKK